MVRKKSDLFDRWDAIILRLALCGLILLAITQTALLLEAPRRFLSQVDRLEGEPFSWQTPLVAEAPQPSPPAAPTAYNLSRLRPGREIVLRLVRPAVDRDITVLVNGNRQGDFTAGEISLSVYDGDYVEVDTGSYSGPVRLIVRTPEGGLESPGDGTVIEGVGGLLPIGKVKLKH